MYEQDILSVLPESLLTEFCQILKTEWLQSITIYYFIRTCHYWKKNDASVDLTLLYYPHDIKTGVFVGILKLGTKTITIEFYALKGHEQLLKKVLCQTSWIPWNEKICFGHILPHHLCILEQVISDKGLQKTHNIDIIDLVALAISIESASKYDISISCPNDVYIAQLTSKDFNYIYENWSQKEDYSIDEVAIPCTLGFGYGVFSKNDNSLLLSWATQRNYGAIGFVHTIEEARGKGYAKMVVKYLSKKLANFSIIPFSITLSGNTVSKSMFKTLGFREIIPSMKNVTLTHLT